MNRGAARKPFKRALVTGAAGGVGSALCRLLAADGTNLVLIDWNEKGLQRLTAELESRVAVDGQLIDIRDYQPFEACLQGIVDKYQDLDLAVANAGIDRPMRFDRYDWREVDDHLATNLGANVVLCSVLVPAFLRRGGGHIVAIASLGGLGGFPYEAAYCSSKAGLAIFIEGVRAEVSPKGVSFTTVFPGFIDTPMLRGNAFEVKSAMTADDAAAKIHRATLERRPTLHFPRPTYLQLVLARLLPARWRDFAARGVMKKDFERREGTGLP